MIDEGYVKFECDWTRGPAPEGIEELVEARNRLRRENLIGIYEDSGIGFGNISQRIAGTDKFVISGTATGGLVTAGAEHFCVVDDWDLQRNHVSCTGPVAASSESMTHAMLYRVAADIQYVVHVHHVQLWAEMLKNGPSTDPSVAYGTPEMALEMERMTSNEFTGPIKILAMAGHDEGIWHLYTIVPQVSLSNWF